MIFKIFLIIYTLFEVTYVRHFTWNFKNYHFYAIKYLVLYNYYVQYKIERNTCISIHLTAESSSSFSTTRVFNRPDYSGTTFMIFTFFFSRVPINNDARHIFSETVGNSQVLRIKIKIFSCPYDKYMFNFIYLSLQDNIFDKSIKKRWSPFGSVMDLRFDKIIASP